MDIQQAIREIVKLGNEFIKEKEEVKRFLGELYERSKEEEKIEGNIRKETRRRHFTHAKDFFAKERKRLEEKFKVYSNS